MEILGKEIDLKKIPLDGITFFYLKGGFKLKVLVENGYSNSIAVKVKWGEVVNMVLFTEQSLDDPYFIKNIDRIILTKIFSQSAAEFILRS